MVIRCILFPALGAVILASAGAEEAVVFSPNEPDEHTLHLWHLDEAVAPFENRASPEFPLRGLQNGARAGEEALPGMGASVFFHHQVGGTPGESDLQGAILTAAPKLATGPEDNVDPAFRYFGEDGAFTYEMVVKLEVKPEDARVIALGLLSMDGDHSDRIFNFRIEKAGFLAFIPLDHGGATGGGIATIPRTGPHALTTEDWFHVAVTYDGREGVTNNLKLYWTKIGADAKGANLIGSGTLANDLNGLTGDLAVGNEARSFLGNAEAEPFPGCIDEVRISGVAREPSDFFFVDPALREPPKNAGEMAANNADGQVFRLKLEDVLVDASSTRLQPGDRPALKLGPGLHRLDFDFGVYPPGRMDQPVRLRCQLEGLDDRWQETARGMGLVVQALSSDGSVLSQTQFPFLGRSEGWQTSLEDSQLTPRREPLFVPDGTRFLRVSLSSGSGDTTGFCCIDKLSLASPDQPDSELWKNGDFEEGENISSPAGVPSGWRRGGTDPAIARVITRNNHYSLGLADGNQTHHGEWSSTQPVNGTRFGGKTLVLAWEETYNVIGGSLHRASYLNVPPGRYTFRAIGLAADGRVTGDISLPVVIEPPVWKQLWFWPVVASALVGMVAAGIVRVLRQRAKRRLEYLKMQNALEQDRTRIARDMHDDLGTRITVLNMTAALAQRDLENDPPKARRHLTKMTDAARELVVAMDDLVWAVDPAHDSLDHLASHLTRLAAELFRESSVRCRLDIPAFLPALSLGSELRHNVALSVKEALHNVLRHAGPCEVFLSLAFDGETLRITVRDTGRGFDPTAHPEGHGLGNLAARFRDIGGECRIDSSIDGGTTLVMTCRLPANHQ